MTYAFQAGDKVVCVDAEPRGGPWVTEGETPVVDRIYTIREIFVDRSGAIGVKLMEIDRCPAARAYWGRLCGYFAWRFKPLVEERASRQARAREPA